jgi:hypothetical protein
VSVVAIASPVVIPITGIVIAVIRIVVMIVMSSARRIPKRIPKIVDSKTPSIIIIVGNISPRRITSPVAIRAIVVMVIKADSRITIWAVIDIAVVDTPTIGIVIV